MFKKARAYDDDEKWKLLVFIFKVLSLFKKQYADSINYRKTKKKKKIKVTVPIFYPLLCLYFFPAFLFWWTFLQKKDDAWMVSFLDRISWKIKTTNFLSTFQYRRIKENEAQNSGNEKKENCTKVFPANVEVHNLSSSVSCV